MEKRKHFYTVGNHYMPWETSYRFLKELKIEPPCDPELPSLGIYPKETKTGSPRDMYTPSFTAV